MSPLSPPKSPTFRMTLEKGASPFGGNVLVTCFYYLSKLTFICSNSTIEAVEKGLEYDVSGVVLVLLLLTLNIIHTFF